MKNGDLAEMTGIILGDGHLHRIGEKSYNNSEVRISLNRVDEEKYVEYVKDIIEHTLGETPREQPRKGNKGIDLKITNTPLVDALKEKGLETGNKTEKQVSVPDWIKENKEYSARCLKGLFDTDGSVYVPTRDKTIHLNFRSASKPLAEDFKIMCNSLGIFTGKVSQNFSRKNGKETIGYSVQIQSRENVKKFIVTIKPEKWENKKALIAEKLSKLGKTIEDSLIDSRKK